MVPQLRAIASAIYLKRSNQWCKYVKLFTEKPEECKFFLEKLLATESDFMGIEPRCLGDDMVAFKTADKFQQSLDVKHAVKKNDVVDDPSVSYRKQPNIKPNLL